MTSSTGKQMITILILSNIGRKKDNQTMKFGRLVDWNMRNIFLKNLTQNVVNKLVPAPLPKNQN